MWLWVNVFCVILMLMFRLIRFIVVYVSGVCGWQIWIVVEVSRKYVRKCLILLLFFGNVNGGGGIRQIVIVIRIVSYYSVSYICGQCNGFNMMMFVILQVLGQVVEQECGFECYIVLEVYYLEVFIYFCGQGEFFDLVVQVYVFDFVGVCFCFFQQFVQVVVEQEIGLCVVVGKFEFCFGVGFGQCGEIY